MVLSREKFSGGEVPLMPYNDVIFHWYLPMPEGGPQACDFVGV